MERTARSGDTGAATHRRRDQSGAMAAATAPAGSAPVLYASRTTGGAPAVLPFRFDTKRCRLDWRLLHGVDVDQVIRTTDLDALERVAPCIAWGDLEADDPRALSETNFTKIFRLAQLLVEYLLHDALKTSNAALEQERAAHVAHIAGLRARLQEVVSEAKHARTELRRARRTVKTYEIMAEARATIGGGGAGGGSAAATLPLAADAAVAPTALQQQEQVAGPADRGEATTAAATTAALLTEVVQLMREQTQHGQQQRQVAAPQLGPVAATAPPTAAPLPVGGWTWGSAAPQSTGNSDADAAAAAAQLSEMGERVSQLVGEVGRLRGEREELSYQLRRLKEGLSARGAAASGGGGWWGTGSTGELGQQGAAAEAEAAAAARQEALLRRAEAAEQLLQAEAEAGREAHGQLDASRRGAAEAAAALASAREAAARAASEAEDLRRQRDAARDALARTEARLRDAAGGGVLATWAEERRALQHQLEAAQAAAAHAQARLGALVASGEAPPAAQQAGAAHPAQPAEGAYGEEEAIVVAAPEPSFELDAPLQQQHDAAPAAAVQPPAPGSPPQQGQQQQPFTPPVARPMQQPQPAPLPPQPSEPQPQQPAPQQAQPPPPHRVQQPHLPPQLQQATGPSRSASPATGGRIDPAAVAALRALEARMAAAPPEELQELTYVEDWEKPCLISEDEEALFRKLLPLEVAGRPGVLAGGPHAAEELDAARPAALSDLNRALDRQLASFGIHPARPGLRDAEFLAAMKLLETRRAESEAALSPEARADAEALRYALSLHAYNALRAAQAAAGGPERLPPAPALLVSAAAPPSAGGATPARGVSPAPEGLAAIRVAPGGGAGSGGGVALPGSLRGPPAAALGLGSPAASRYLGSGDGAESEDDGGGSMSARAPRSAGGAASPQPLTPGRGAAAATALEPSLSPLRAAMAAKRQAGGAFASGERQQLFVASLQQQIRTSAGPSTPRGATSRLAAGAGAVPVLEGGGGDGGAVAAGAAGYSTQTAAAAAAAAAAVPGTPGTKALANFDDEFDLSPAAGV
ncbi:hypothetical protein Rsub_08748 [Raphidocelis subcapitata]|uniref:Cilium assembly protein DZIP1 N-terminal domain-containing protein n=1 Tax=Raphidocelis subcapitata TaxID=307507 RepID=A0A2V0PE82_9CHLO|nr:hypothetical protein Rsub_08748 [Raphidocelis subcapitata]|eukprot:GBF96203.1 hypothetical protein Rsub_08748 [Raphidocelis subcapitata]